MALSYMFDTIYETLLFVGYYFIERLVLVHYKGFEQCNKLKGLFELLYLI